MHYRVISARAWWTLKNFHSGPKGGTYWFSGLAIEADCKCQLKHQAYDDVAC